MKRMQVKRGLGASREALRQLFFQRCFYLFTTLLAMILLAPFIEGEHGGVLARNVINLFVVLSAVAAVYAMLGGISYIEEIGVAAIHDRNQYLT